MPHKTENGQSIDLQKIMNDLRAVVEDGQRLLKAGATEVRSRAVQGAKSTDRFVRGYPYQTLGMALGLGIVAGVFLARAFHCDEAE